MKVVIIDYGAGNIFSVQQAFKRLGIEATLSNEEAEIRTATHVIFPGVGHAKSAMEQLKSTGLDKMIPTLKQPVLGICLGMQLMCGWNEEGNLDGLGIFQARIQLIKSQFPDYPIPHMGWNDVQLNGKSETFYFVHSYVAEICEETSGITSYPTPFSAALKKDNFYGVQFHPEKSGVAGENLLNQFLAE
ncbi:imidazole glycerol phosphate synthase subunit HisH [Fluviicola taffensis]|uniref:Imidazole glycerol phosphate synthase subunit HisH n=1 Tax=Fluviicola taffensis (strain DSM 16823 / NCIMB 13979 / RW262) TaxID=755732 RepID=F2IDA4_FLUTR|nr:imidazole glycerol phosphate synthase subunit HisH [Fluviicola taffensis]AEA45519.1 Imidazole glycerol phosphate synthase subunit hisH [Fluviicola taffensis DSM 16823]